MTGAIPQVDCGFHPGRCRPHRRRTCAARPLMRLPGAALGVDCAELWLKLEHLQRSGSFKARGMFNRMLAQPLPAAGVVVASGGNAGIAVA
jgi:threonine dehydratase